MSNSYQLRAEAERLRAQSITLGRSIARGLTVDRSAVDDLTDRAFCLEREADKLDATAQFYDPDTGKPIELVYRLQPTVGPRNEEPTNE